MQKKYDLMNKNNKGFTLIELMIVVVIIALLAGVAVPSYLESVRDSKRADAKASLINFAGAMERYKTENNSYTGATVANTGTPLTIPIDGGTSTYRLSVVVATASSYLLTATAENTMAGDDCGDYTLTSTGVKNVINATRAKNECW